MLVCFRCKKKITGSYVRAIGHNWHSKCFFCQECKKIINSDNFIIFKDNPWHPACLKCPGCGKSVRNEFIEKNNQAWHVKCYQKKFSPICAVCKKILPKRYLQDFWGNRYCPQHKNYALCSSCSRVVCGNITGGGTRHPDGVVICNICSSSGISTSDKAYEIMDEMRLVLKKIGLNLFNAETPVRLVDRDELHQYSRHKNHDTHPLLGLARWQIVKSGSRVVERNFQEILVQKQLPETHFRSIMIHELCHAWFFYNQYEGIPLYVEEGMCVLMEYLWLKSKKTKTAMFFLRNIQLCDDPIYGRGFQEALKSMKRLRMKYLLQFIKEKRKFPGPIAAFFYH